jgi:hypothetical protein
VNRWPWIVGTGVAATLALAGFLALRPSARPTLRTQPAVPMGARPVVAAGTHPRLVSGTAGKNLSRSEWTAKFRASDDYLKFIKEALPAAVSGDGRAAWYIKEALSSCANVVRTYRGSADPQAQLQQQLEGMPHAPQWARDLLEKKTNRCLGLAQNDPFVSLPERQGGYPSAYWYEQALADDDPLAHEHKAADAIAAISVNQNMSEAERTKRLEVVETNLRTAVQSGDPDALYHAGALLTDGRYSSNPLNGIAVALAACDLGHDCSAGNPENSWSNCKLNGACPADADYAYFIQQSLGPEKYAQTYSHAQEIEQSIRAGDWDSVLTNLAVDKR